MTYENRSVTILGAGLSGASVALELATQGVAVTLIERDALPFSRASLRNEGKIHLGLIYANDRSLATARLQLEGALTFSTHLRRWLGPVADTLRRSTPFHYLVAKDSLLNADQLEAHYAAVQTLYDEQRALMPALDYMGTRPERLTVRDDPARLSAHLRMERFAAAFETAEVAVDTAQLAHLVREALAKHPLIELRVSHRVDSVAIDGPGFVVTGQGPSGPWAIRSEQVVNCLWEDRLRIDQGLGLVPPPGWVHRLKYRVIARLPQAMRQAPSVTMVLGPYGDVVVRDDGTAYFSWYPLGCKGWSHDLAPPHSWDAPCRAELSIDEAAAVAKEVLGAIDEWYPGAAGCEPLLVDAGAIVGYGSTDVNDPASGLHDRTRVGVNSHGGYHSLDPGKLTTAPMFGQQAASKVLQAL
ncbi:FAD-dependent oxidoreductase [Methylibium sp.]|uniref:FAD-dependent oxidoreductase n=1 Tax=Methylibium sp. TaxID=2067992 RepID=UPI0025D42488|nr:FAD-dependent oxidoreductase [Methylibium sp.]